jgi:hypothetical protein
MAVSVFELEFEKNDNANLCLLSPSKYKEGDKVTTSMYSFYNRLYKKIGIFIDEDFQWSNIIIAGGLISGLIESQPAIIEYQQSDVDIFVFGTEEIVRKKIQYIYDYFVKKLEKKFYSFMYTPNVPIICIVIPGECSIQIIGTEFLTALGVLNSFDFSHCQVGFDGNQILYTDAFIDTVKSRITKITKHNVHAYRLVKAYKRGYSIIKPKYGCSIKNIFQNYTTEDGTFVPSDESYDIHDLQQIITELSNNPIVQKNLTKNYIPKIDSIYSHSIEMIIIGTLYAGENKYQILNDHNNEIFVKDITRLLVFPVKMKPFLLVK